MPIRSKGAANQAVGERRVFIPTVLRSSSFWGAGSQCPVKSLSGATMGTYWQASTVTPLPVSLERQREVLQGAFDDVVRQMSGWDVESDLCRFNRGAAGGWHRLPEAFFLVLKRALEIAEETGGRYDPTVGASVDVWGFGSGAMEGELPDAARIEEARQRTGWQRLRCEDDGRRVYQPGGVRVDLSSIAKGFGVDLAAKRLAELGVESFLIEVGGELRGQGCKPDGQPWWCLLETPPEAERASWVLPSVIALCDAAVATSGDFRRYREVGARRYSHLIDPHTGRAEAGVLASVSTVCPSCMDADAYATALFALGLEEGIAFAERKNIPALFRWRGAEGLEERLTSSLAAMLE